MGRKFAGFVAVAALAAGLLVSSSASGATPGLDLILKDPPKQTTNLVRPEPSRKITTDYLATAPFATTGKTPLEIWARRPDPAGPLLVDSIDRSSGQPVATTLDVLATMGDGLSGLLSMEIRNEKGKVVLAWNEGFCPNGYGNASTSASREKTNTIPIYPGPFYAYGSCGEEQADSLVWLVARGRPAYHYASKPLGLPDGSYRLKITLNPNRILPEKSYDNNTTVQKFSVTTDRKLWKRLLRGSGSTGSGSSSSSGGSVVVSPRQDRQPRVRPPKASDIDGAPGALPDPAALPASKFNFMRENGKELISFSSIVKNAGEAPIALFGKRKETKSESMPGWQYLKDADGKLERRPTNGFVWDQRDTHFHWHYNRLASYELLAMDGTVLRKSAKVGFCFMPTTALHLIPAPGPFGVGMPIGYEDDNLPVNCGERRSTRVSMSLPAGWGDEYFQGIAGQSFNVSDLPEGSYRLRITVNPEGDLAETTADNNVSERLLTLGSSNGRRTLTVPRQGFVSGEFYPIADQQNWGRASASAFGPTASSAAGPARLLCGLTPRALRP